MSVDNKSVSAMGNAQVPRSADVSAMTKARNYQQEMYEESLNRNIIVAMDTGSGKTHIAIMRIQHMLGSAEGRGKLSWFLAPNVSLAEQQSKFIEQYLPPGSVQIITGNHGVDTWSTQKIWDQALTLPVIVTTPQVLYDALCHGFVNIDRIAVLIFDEAHHCRSNHVYNRIMQEFYHTYKRFDMPVPAILGLSASPIIKTQQDLSVIEANLDAIARTPLKHREELMAHVNRPTLKLVEYNPDEDFVEAPPKPPLASYLPPRAQSAAPKATMKHTSSSLLSSTSKKQKGGGWFDHLDPDLAATVLGGLPSQPSSTKKHEPKAQSLMEDDEEFEMMIVEDETDLPDRQTSDGDTIFQTPDDASLLGSKDTGEDYEIFGGNEAEAIVTSVRKRRECPVFQSLVEAYKSMDIMKDPYVIELMKQEAPNLHSTISSKRTDSQTQMRRLVDSADHLLTECGPWAAEWFICAVIGEFLGRELVEKEETIDEFEGEESGFWRTEAEEIYLRRCLEKVKLPEKKCDITTNISAKAKKLLDVLLEEHSVESDHEEFSGLVFVNQRVAVAAVAQIIREHPKTRDIFRVGTMVGSSEGTGKRVKFIQDLISSKRNNSLAAFREGKMNLLIATAAIQEGVDVRDCHLVTCFDLPKILVEYIQRRGRARRKVSSYVLMYSVKDNHRVAEFEATERAMIEEYMDPGRETATEESLRGEALDMRMDRDMRIPTTGAMFNLGNVIPHLNHFCACLPEHEYVNTTPQYRTEKALLPDGEPKWSATVTLPNSVDSAVRCASSTRLWMTEEWAKRDAAFESFKLLHEKGLVNDNLMPLHRYLNIQEDMILKRPSKMEVPGRLDPWELIDKKWDKGELFVVDIDVDFASGEKVGVQMVLPMEVPEIEDLVLFWTKDETARATFGPCRQADNKSNLMGRAQKASYRLFRNMYSRRMHEDEKRYEFAYLFAPRSGHDWDESSGTFIEALEAVGKDHSDIGVVRDKNDTPYIFRRFRKDISLLEAEEFRGPGARDPATVKQDQPLLEVTKLSKRRDFLHPEAGRRKGEGKVLLLLPEFLFIDTLPWRYTQLALFVPFLVDRVGKAILAADLKQTLQFKGIPEHLIVQAVTASSARDPIDYQRLEFLGDSVLKVLTSIALVDEFPLWHEGYLSGGKDRVVSNTTLAEKSKEKGMSKWINTVPFTAQKWTPRYRGLEGADSKGPNTKALSTKVLADVVESLIGAAYLTSGFAAATEVLKTFNLSSLLFPWHPIDTRVDSLLAAAAEKDRNYRRTYPTYFDDLEAIIGYRFNNRALLLEAVTHVSFGGDSIGTSYQRLEFLGDSILDMVIVQKLYHWPGKQLSHIQMHHLKSATVNAHFLAFLCLSAGIEVTKPETDQRVRKPVEKKRWFPLYQFLRHNHPELADGQRKTAKRYEKLKDTIRRKLGEADEYPWEDIHKLDAPKHLSDMIESIIGAIWVDTRGSFEAVEAFLEKMGVGTVLKRLVDENMIVNHPLSRFGIYAAADGMMRSVRYGVEMVRQGEWKCELRVDDELLVTTTGVNKAHVRTKAARIGLKLLEEKDREKRQADEAKKAQNKEGPGKSEDEDDSRGDEDMETIPRDTIMTDLDLTMDVAKWEKLARLDVRLDEVDGVDKVERPHNPDEDEDDDVFFDAADIID